MLQYLTGVGPLLGVIALTIAWGFLRLSTRRSDRHAPPPPRPFWLDGALIALFKGDLPDASVVSHQRGGPVYGRYFLGRDTVYVSGTFRSGSRVQAIEPPSGRAQSATPHARAGNRLAGASNIRKVLIGENSLVESLWPPAIKSLLGPGSLSNNGGAIHARLR